MAVVIVATVGSATANSFVTSAEATTYHEGRLNSSAWSAAVADDQNRALVEATRELNLLAYSSLKTNSTQALQWPRWFAPNRDPSADSQWYYDSTIVPQRVKDATCELALEFLKAGSTDIAALDSTINVIEKTVDVLTTRYAEPEKRRQGLARFPRVWSLIAPLLDGAFGSTPIIRG